MIMHPETRRKKNNEQIVHAIAHTTSMITSPSPFSLLQQERSHLGTGSAIHVDFAPIDPCQRGTRLGLPRHPLGVEVVILESSVNQNRADVVGGTVCVAVEHEQQHGPHTLKGRPAQDTHTRPRNGEPSHLTLPTSLVLTVSNPSRKGTLLEPDSCGSASMGDIATAVSTP